MISSRATKYSKAVLDTITELGHASNAELIDKLRLEFPDLSATTVHRVTSRLVDSGALALAPPESDGSMKFDINTSPHDHFICRVCGGIKDINVVDDVMPTIVEALGGCRVSGRLTIQGECEKCKVKLRG